MQISKRVQETVLNSGKNSMFVYDLQVMNSKMDLLSCLSEQVHTYYAMKANPNHSVIKNALEHPNITWIEVASLGEMEKVLNAWWTLEKVIYTWPSKTEQELEFWVKNNIHYLNVESWKELLLVDELAKKYNKKQKVLIRLNTKHKFEEWEAWVTLWSGDTQFGFPQVGIENMFPFFSKLKNIEIDGFHMYPASWVISAEALLKSVESAFKFMNDIEEKTWIKFKTIDFWWGFGVDYEGNKEFDIEKYANWLKELIKKYNMEEKELILELWRYIAADMWYFVTKVNDIKTLQSWAKAVLCYAWTNAHKRPQVLKVDYKLWVIKNPNPWTEDLYKKANELWLSIDKVSKNDTFNVYGPFCTSVDKIAEWKTGYDIEIGDYIVQLQAGAYWKTMSPKDFLSHPEVPEIIIK